jgi:hypothetical protein
MKRPFALRSPSAAVTTVPVHSGLFRRRVRDRRECHPRTVLPGAVRSSSRPRGREGSRQESDREGGRSVRVTQGEMLRSGLFEVSF